MKYRRYDNLESFETDVLGTLMENEAQNNLPISFLRNKGADVSSWLLASIQNNSGGVVMVAACTPPFNIVLYETGNLPNEEAEALLSRELHAAGFVIPGVTAEGSLARRFASIHSGPDYTRHLEMNVMRLDRVEKIEKAPGFMRPLAGEDMFFAPYWERAFQEDSGVEVYGIRQNHERIIPRLGQDIHFFWEDGVPVSQAVHGRSILTGAVVNGVYTPPHCRGRGYASSLVSTLSGLLLERGYRFCCLFADAANPISCGIYRKLGYRDICVYEDIVFGKKSP